MIQQILIIAHVIVSVLMIGIILLQQGKGADAGASFGAGGSQTVLGAAGSASILVKITSTLTLLFFLLSFALAYYAKFVADKAGFIEINAEETAEPTSAVVGTSTQAIDNNVEVPVADTSEVPTAEKENVAAPVSDVPEVPAN